MRGKGYSLRYTCSPLKGEDSQVGFEATGIFLDRETITSVIGVETLLIELIN